MQKGQILIWIIIGVMVTAVAGGAYYLGRSSSPKPSPIPTVVSQTPQPTLSQTPTPDETANWRTYTSTSGKFTIKYPIEWKVLNGGSLSTGTEIVSFGPNITGVTEDLNIKMWIQMQSATNPNSSIKNAEDYKNSLVKGYSSNPNSNISVTAATVDGVSGFKLSYIDSGVKITNILIDKNGLVYSIAIRQTTPYSEQDLQIFNQILSTFRFD